MIDHSLEVPGSVRHFVHKRIFGGIKGLITGGPTGALGGFLAPTDVRARPPVLRVTPRKIAVLSASQNVALSQIAEVRKGLGFAAKCKIWETRNPTTQECETRWLGQPVRPEAPVSAFHRDAQVGGAKMGRYGAGLEPGSRIIDRAICLRGMVLGNDGLCYNRSQIKNSERMWPRGRRPLLTGGDMRAISIASRAANKLTRTAVRLHEIGLIKKPIARKPRKKN